MSSVPSARREVDGSAPSRRFLLLASVFSLLYAILAAVGPYGVVPVPVWPEVAQQSLQTRAWLGEDIVVESDGGEQVIEVEPRLDVTPYLAHRVVQDPREESIVANIACVVRLGSDRGQLMPLQEAQALGLVTDEALRDRVECHVGFPPGPAALLLPVRAVLDGMVPVQLVGALLGGLAVAGMDRLFGMAAGGAPPDGRDAPPRLELTLLAGLGTLWVWAAPQASTWLFSQTAGTSALTFAMLCAGCRRPWSAGVFLAVAVASRPPMILAVPVLVALMTSGGSSPRWSARSSGLAVATLAARLLAAPAVAIGAMATLNWLRFGSPTDFGYRYMLTPPVLLERMLAHGQLSLAYLGENLRSMFVAPPRLLEGFPYLVSDPWGMGILFVTPAVMVAVVDGLRPARRTLKAAAWASAAAITAPALLYFNTGWVQWGGRFLLDSWPVWLLLIAWGWRGVPTGIRRVLLLASMVSNLWAAALTAARVWPGCCM